MPVMNIPINLSKKLFCLQSTLYFFKKHFLVIVGLGLIAAFGRVIQLGGFGEISSTTNVISEIAVESARVLLFLYVLGLANIKNGILRIRNFFSNKVNKRLQWSIALQNLKKQWSSILLNVIGFSLIALALNFLIEKLAYETCLYLTLRKDGILAQSSSAWTILLFFKNISVIPFTLIFQTLLVLWLLNKLTNSKSIQIIEQAGD